MLNLDSSRSASPAKNVKPKKEEAKNKSAPGKSAPKAKKENAKPKSKSKSKSASKSNKSASKTPEKKKNASAKKEKKPKASPAKKSSSAVKKSESPIKKLKKDVEKLKKEESKKSSKKESTNFGKDYKVQPKNPTSPYIFFNTATVKRLKEEKGLDHKDAFKQAGEMWNTLSEADKKEWIDMGEKDKVRHEKELQMLEQKGYFVNSDGVKSTDLPVDPKKKWGKDVLMPK